MDKNRFHGHRQISQTYIDKFHTLRQILKTQTDFKDLDNFQRPETGFTDLDKGIEFKPQTQIFQSVKPDGVNL